MRDPFIDICRGVSQLLGFWLVSSLWYFLVPFGDFMISYSSLGQFREASVKWVASRRFSRSPPSKLLVPFVYSHSSHHIEGLSSMHRTFSTGQSVWSCFDQFWVAFHGELLGDDVISWPYSFRVWNKNFRDLEALVLWIYVIGVVVPKYVYNKGDTTNMLEFIRHHLLDVEDGIDPINPFPTSTPITTSGLDYLPNTTTRGRDYFLLEIVIPTTALNTLTNTMLAHSTTARLQFCLQAEGLKSEQKYNT